MKETRFGSALSGNEQEAQEEEEPRHPPPRSTTQADAPSGPRPRQPPPRLPPCPRSWQRLLTRRLTSGRHGQQGPSPGLLPTPPSRAPARAHRGKGGRGGTSQRSSRRLYPSRALWRSACRGVTAIFRGRHPQPSEARHHSRRSVTNRRRRLQGYGTPRPGSRARPLRPSPQRAGTRPGRCGQQSNMGGGDGGGTGGGGKLNQRGLLG